MEATRKKGDMTSRYTAHKEKSQKQILLLTLFVLAMLCTTAQGEEEEGTKAMSRY